MSDIEATTNLALLYAQHTQIARNSKYENVEEVILRQALPFRRNTNGINLAI